jgi:hypothetical protein
MSERPKLFDDDDDLSRFAPRAPETPVPPSTVRVVSEAGGFPSRESRPLRQPYRYRTGRTEQFSARIRPEAFDAFYDIAKKNGWKIGETVEKALAALQRELGDGR